MCAVEQPSCLTPTLTHIVCWEIRRTFISSSTTCQLFGAGSGANPTAQSGSASFVLKPLTTLDPASPTGCTGGFCNFVPNSAVIRCAR